MGRPYDERANWPGGKRASGHPRSAGDGREPWDGQGTGFEVHRGFQCRGAAAARKVSFHRDRRLYGMAVLEMERASGPARFHRGRFPECLRQRPGSSAGGGAGPAKARGRGWLKTNFGDLAVRFKAGRGEPCQRETGWAAAGCSGFSGPGNVFLKLLLSADDVV